MMKNKRKDKCKYGRGCYRKNPQHFNDYYHSDDDNDQSDDKQTEVKKRKIQRHEENVEEKNHGAGSTEPSEDVSCLRTQKPDEPSGKGIEDAPDSPVDVKENIKAKFLVEMPNDFYEFFEFAKSIDKKHPTDAFKATLGVELVGPYDVLADKCRRRNSRGEYPCYLRHWRYFYDPPEFLTVIRGDDQRQFHMGYFRDDPSEMPVFVGSNAAKENCIITPRGENLFAAFSWLIEDTLKNAKSKEALQKLKEKLEQHVKSCGIVLDKCTARMKARDKKCPTRTFHQAGMCVPVDSNNVGYRELPATPGELKKMFKAINEAKDEEEKNKATDPLLEIIMLVQFANDECDYGEGLELGLDMFLYGSESLHGHIMQLLPLAYQLLQRHAFADIITAHLRRRRHSSNLSELD